MPDLDGLPRRVTGENVELQAYLQRVAGYASLRPNEHALFFLYGTGANGKSSSWTPSRHHGRLRHHRRHRHVHGLQQRPAPDRNGRLRGARLVSAIETEEGRRWAESKLKALTGGDKVAARFMRQDFFEFIPQFKL